MKSIKKLFTSASLALALLFSVNANAVLITQDIVVDGDVFGEVAFEVSNSALNSGAIIDTFFDGQPAFAGISFFGVDTDALFSFDAVLDTSNISAGLEFLSFDSLNGSLIFQLVVDTFSGSGFLDVFDANNDLIFFSSDVTLGSVNVSEPGMAVLLVMLLAGVFAARRK
ncbi:hypothetical protein J3L16_11410 [Alteromonas sp. 5E99-2]|uniref:hypothetical protein n=1 Tax=Alteromonas sp. 5E99-2 TaxID=2817683 RepID=UPI001A97E5DA|nr:hypothetical protein [Alteromonas sp. 5E99-2]MBO1256289.1 hypothetical protein [Alteromonas sp. 5E99-2]